MLKIVEIDKIIRVSIGQTTSTFQILKKKDLISHSLSIIYLNDGEKALDIIALKDCEYSCIVKTVQTLVDESKQKIQSLSKDQLYVNHLWSMFTMQYNFQGLQKHQNFLIPFMEFDRSNSIRGTADFKFAVASTVELNHHHQKEPMLGLNSFKFPRHSKYVPPFEFKETTLLQMLSYINYKRPAKDSHNEIVKHLLNNFDDDQTNGLEKGEFTDAIYFLFYERDEMKLLWNEIVNAINDARLQSQIEANGASTFNDVQLAVVAKNYNWNKIKSYITQSYLPQARKLRMSNSQSDLYTNTKLTADAIDIVDFHCFW